MKLFFRSLGFRIWYWYVNKIDKKAEVLLMNYGYADSDLSVALEPQDEGDRYSIQLYHYVAGAINLENKAITEIGCGRGGGLAHIVKNFSPASARGLDLDKQAIAFCKKHYPMKELSFLQGDAQKMPMDNDTCDVVINVESSHRYPDMKSFLNEVQRILRVDGYFLLTDFRNDYEVDAFQKELQSCGMKILKEEIITPQVVSALELDDGRRRQLVEKLTPGFLHKTALNFAGALGSETYNRFVASKYVYFNYILQKN